jgi:predicted RNase H-like HicB family nuclease
VSECAAAGDTKEGTRRNFQEAVSAHFDAMREIGEAIPAPSASVGYVEVASEGASIEEARANLIEALTSFFETASSSEVARRSHNEIFVTQLEVPVG